MINSVQKAMQILRLISEGRNKPVSLAKIAETTGINKSTCSHILSTLLAEGYIVRISSTQGYILGPELFCLSRFGKYENDFIETCHPILKYLHKKSGCAVVLAVIQNGKKYIIDQIDTDDKVLHESAEIIKTNDLYRTATGRIILANMGKNKVSEIFDKNGPPPADYWPEVTSLETLVAQLAAIKKRGIVKTLDISPETDYYIYGYGAAIFRYNQCVGALGLATKHSAEEDERYLENEHLYESLLLKARNEIGRRLTYNSSITLVQ